MGEMNARSRATRQLVALVSLAALLAVVTTACSEETVPVQEAASPQTAELSEPVPVDEPTEVAAAPPPVEPTVEPTSRPIAAAPARSSSGLRPIAPTTFVVGNTLGRGMMLRQEPVPGNSGTVWPDGTTMEGLGAERVAYGWTWLWVRDPNSTSGWIPAEYLVRAGDGSEEEPGPNASSLPLPSTPTRLATPPAELPPPTPSASTPPGPPAALASAPSSSASARPPLTSTAGVVVSGQTVVASGRSALKTKPFALATGSYTVAWRGRGKGNCIGDITSVDGAQDKNFLNVILEAPERGETQVYGVKAGQFYLDMTCDDWAVAIVPQGQDAL